MAHFLSCLILSELCVIFCVASYVSDSYRPRYSPPSYQTYDRRLVDAYKPAATTDSYPSSYGNVYSSSYGDPYGSSYRGGSSINSYQSSFPTGGGYQNVYRPQKGYGSTVYGSHQTRNTYSTPHGGSLGSGYQLKAPSAHVTAYSTKNDYSSHSVKSYGSKTYDPCHSLPEGDYSIQGDFRSLFSGVDSQCNFIKCANYKAYVNPCSIGTKNGDNGGPHPKYGFCASMDYNHYCGHYPSSPQELIEYK